MVLSYPIWKVQSQMSHKLHSVRDDFSCKSHQPSVSNPTVFPACDWPAPIPPFFAFLECVCPDVEKVNFVKRVTTCVTAVTHCFAGCSCWEWIQLQSNGNALLQVFIFLGNIHRRVECTVEIFSWSVNPTVRNKIMCSLIMKLFGFEPII